MLIKPMAGEGPGTTAIPDDVWISIKNSTGAALSQGYLVCYNVTNNASANGLDCEKPLTSALTAFLGVVDNGSDTTYAIDDTRAGLAKAKGLVDGFLRTESTDGANSKLEGQRRNNVIPSHPLHQTGKGICRNNHIVINEKDMTAFHTQSRLAHIFPDILNDSLPHVGCDDLVAIAVTPTGRLDQKLLPIIPRLMIFASHIRLA